MKRVLLCAALCAAACEQAAPVEHPVAPAPLPVAMFAVAPKPSGVPWASEAPPAWVAEPQGKPITMAAGARCKSFRRLPTLRYSANTLVEDACLEIPSDTTIEIREGATLAIVATNGLLLGKNVVFDARGLSGPRGARATFASVTLSADSDSEIRALCVDHGNQCGCPSAESSSSTIRGQAGGSGTGGGSLRLLAAEILSPKQLSGFAIDVSGGVGGPPGESGTRSCTRGALSCMSPECSEGTVFGARGQSGSLSISLAGSVPAASLALLKSALSPADAAALVVAELGTALAVQAEELNVQAVRKNWQRRAGSDSY